MYLVAGIGIYTQVVRARACLSYHINIAIHADIILRCMCPPFPPQFSGFAVFFPLNLVLFPLTVIEWFLRYQVTFGGTAPK